MAARFYTLPIVNGAITLANGDYDLWEMTPADDKPIELVGIEIQPTTELGDAQEEMMRIEVVTGHATSGSGGSAATPQRKDTADVAASFTAETLNSTIASTGTAVTRYATAYNVRSGLEKNWALGEGIKIAQADVTLVIRLPAAVADDMNVNGTATVAEY